MVLSTSSVYPESTAAGFSLARELGYDGIEVMVGVVPTSAVVDAVGRLSVYHVVPVVAVLAPTLLAALALVVDLQVAFLATLPILGVLLWLYHERPPKGE